VTGLRQASRRPARWTVEVDGEVVATLSSVEMGATGLFEGQSLSPDELQTSLDRAFGESARSLTLRYMSYRPRSIRELRSYLRRHGIPDGVVDREMERLETADLAGDVDFAAFWAENRTRFAPRGRMALAHELRQKGVGRGDIEAGLAGLPSEEQLAYQAGLRKGRLLASSDRDHFFQAMHAFLRRRGFSGEVAFAAAKRLWDTAQQADDPDDC